MLVAIDLSRLNGTYITVATTSVVVAGRCVLVDLTGAGECGATHLVQIVEVTVSYIVETAWVTWTISRVPDVTVCVTGQVV